MSERELVTALAATKRPLAAAFVRTSAPPSDELVQALERIEGKLAARMDLVRLDLDACPALVREHRIHKAPELLVWAAGGRRLLARTEGAMRDDEALGLLEHALTRV